MALENAKKILTEILELQMDADSLGHIPILARLTQEILQIGLGEAADILINSCTDNQELVSDLLAIPPFGWVVILDWLRPEPKPIGITW